MFFVIVLAVLVHLVSSKFDPTACGHTKGCFIPAEPECYNGCNGMQFSWYMVNGDLMQVELTVNAHTAADNAYVAIGFSSDDMMGDDSVIECSALGNDPLSLKLSFNVNSTTDPTSGGEPTNWRLSSTGSAFFLNSSVAIEDGVMYCHATLNVTGASAAGLLQFSPDTYYYLLMANGPTNGAGLLHHVHDVTSATPLALQNVLSGFDIDACGVQKGCFLASQSNHVLTGLAVSYKVLNSSFIALELMAPSSTAEHFYVAVTFSAYDVWSNAPTIECSSISSEALSMKFSYINNNNVNVRIPGEPGIRDQYFSEETAAFQNNQVYCSAVVNVQGSPISNEIFTYDVSTAYYLLLTTGNTTATGLDTATGRAHTATPSKLSIYEENFDANGCGNDKVCVLPTSCYGGCNGMGFSYKMVSSSFMHIELFATLSAGNQYIAVGFSNDALMGDDHVIECSALVNESFSLKFSYNNNSPKNVRIPGEQGIRSSYFTFGSVSNSDAQLYCTALVNVSGWSGSSEVFRYNPRQQYYLLLASGFTDANGLVVHKHTFVSSSRLLGDLGGNADSGYFDKSTCGVTKGCFTSEDASTMKASYQASFPFLPCPSRNKYDNKMGHDNVIECSTIGSSSLSMKFSYNPSTYNARINEEQQIESLYFRNETAKIADGVMYCSAVVNVSGWSGSSQVFTYDPKKTYYLLLASGVTTASGLARHKITAVSTPRLLSDYESSGSSGMSPATKQRLVKAHAILMILSWFFFVPTAVMFARFLRSSWPIVKPGGLLIWFHVHRSFNLLALALNISSFICILTANNWTWTGPGSHSSKWGKVHTMVGVFALCLAWLQPFVSAMRLVNSLQCNPTHPRRPFFNWVHRLIGLMAVILATTAVCIAADHFDFLWSYKVAQIVLSVIPLALLIVLSAVFFAIDKVKMDEFNFEKVHQLRQHLVVVGVVIVAGVAITLSTFVGIGT
ncbi:hypothetical protein Q1695_012169 [Nippostrongylus brasiliensis]|nr:hypothetical protein Q1695_012169 [Nippostrongylus brasiliensis]